jgi:carbamoyl-phosphate synthase large subunit
MMQNNNVLVTGVGGRSVGSGILHSLKRSKYVSKDWKIIASDCEPFSWGLYIADEAVLLPPAYDASYISAVSRVVGKYNIAAIIPGTQVEIEILAKHEKDFCIPIIINRPELIPLMIDKSKIGETLKQIGCESIPEYTLDEKEIAIEKHGYPFILKPAKGSGGSFGLNIIDSEKEMNYVLPHLDKTKKWLLQPYVGDGESEYTVGVLSDWEGNIIDSIVMKRKLIGLSLLQKRASSRGELAISTGYSQGYIVRDKQIQEYCETLAVKLNSRGPINFQLRKDGDKIFIFEIHPRFSGTTTIRSDVGFNEVDILLNNVLYGKKYSRLSYLDNMMCIRAFEHVVVPIAVANKIIKA